MIDRTIGAGNYEGKVIKMEEFGDNSSYVQYVSYTLLINRE